MTTTLRTGCALALFLGLAGFARAQTQWANPVNGNWNVATNWNPAVVPTGNAEVSVAGTYTVTLVDNRSVTNLTLNNPTATVSHVAGTLTLGGTLALTAGTYALDGGILSGGAITTAGGTVRLGTATSSRLTDVAVGAGVLNFSNVQGRVKLTGTTALAAGTTVALNGGSNVLSFDQTVTLNNLAVNFTAINGRFQVETGRTVTLAPTVTLTNTSGGAAFIDLPAFATGCAVVNQGLIRNTGGTTVTVSGSELTFTNAGTLQVTQNSFIVNDNLAGFTNFSAGTLTGGTYLAQGGTMNFGTRQVTTLAANTTAEVSGTFGAFGALNTLTANAGTLRVLNNLSFNPSGSSSIANSGVIEVGATATLTSDLAVSTGGSLRGGGIVVGVVAFGGTNTTLLPGSTVGTLTVTGDLTLNAGTTVTLDLNGNTAGTTHDQVAVSGAVALGNAALSLTLGYTPAAGDRLFVVNKTSAGAIPDTFAGYAEGATVLLPGGGSAKISYQGNFDTLALTGGNDVVLYNFVPVPEPTAVLAVAAGGLLAAWTVRRSRRPRRGRPSGR